MILGAEPYAAFLGSILDNALETGKSPAANEQDIAGIHLKEFLLRVLAPTLRGYRCDRSFNKF